jgi:hypothetical protein
MDRTPPRTNSDEIELYIRTYYSLLRSSGPIRIRSLEETHMAMKSNLHFMADSPDIDISALVYSALRLPDAIVDASLMVMGQMEDVFAREGYPLDAWKPVKARARRRKYFFNPDNGVMAAFVASVSDIDDLIPCMVTFQIEWNKIHQRLMQGVFRNELLTPNQGAPLQGEQLIAAVQEQLGLSQADAEKLSQLWPGAHLLANLRKAAAQRMDMRVIVLGSGLGDYRRSVQTWWNKVETAQPPLNIADRPIYFVSSNIHSLPNLISGLAHELKQGIVDFVERENPEDLWSEYSALPPQDNGHLFNFLYYATRMHMAGAHNRRELEELSPSASARWASPASVTRAAWTSKRRSSR